MKQKMKNALIVITIVGLLGVAVSSSGCETPIPTTMTATWHSTGVAFRPGGLTVTGQLLVSSATSTKPAPFPYQTINLTATNDLSLGQTVVLKQTKTDAQGKFAFAIGPSEDKYLLYATVFEASGYQTQLTIVGGYRGLEYGINTLAQNITKLPTSTFGIGGKATLLTLLGTARMQVDLGQIGGAGTNLNIVLAKMDAATATKGAPAALVNTDYTAYLLTKDCKWLSGVPWTWPERPAPS
ncbi:MAG: hypothetical protein ACXV2B_07405 [Halobacteriota archaeon]